MKIMKIIVISLLILSGSSALANNKDDVSYADLIKMMELLGKDVEGLEEKISKAKKIQGSIIVYLKKQNALNEIYKKEQLALRKTDIIFPRKINKNQYYKVTAKKLTLRTSASFKSKPRGWIIKHDIVEAICTKNKKWCYLPNFNAFVSKRYLKNKK